MRFPPVDLFSFILGFLLGLVGAFIVMRLNKMQPQLKAARENRKKKIQVSDISECERLYKLFMLRKCQQSHLASALFPLNNVYVDLRLIGRAYYSTPEYYLENEPMVFQHFPIAFGDPEGYADLPAPLLTLDQALDGGRNIVIMNEIGSGKTTLLAQYTSLILEEKIDSTKFPVFINIKELKYQESDGSAFIEDLVGLIHQSNAKMDVENLQTLLISAAERSSLILLLDGFDELPLDRFHEAVRFTASIMAKYPQMRIVLASGPNYADGLYKLGFAPLSLQFPTTTQKAELIKSWVDGWNRISAAKGSLAKSYLLNTLWLLQDAQTISMTDLTLAIWANLALDHVPSHYSYLFDYVQRSISGILSFETLIKLAEEIAKSEKLMISHDETINLIKKDPLTSVVIKESRGNTQGEGSRKEKTVEQGFDNIETVLDYLIEINILAKKRDGYFSFSNPSVMGFLLAYSKTYVVRDDWKYLLHSPMDSLILRYTHRQNTCLAGWIADNDPYLNRNLMLTGQQMRFCKEDRGNFPTFARRLLPIILDDHVPLSLRLKLFTYFDIDAQSRMQLLNRLQNHPSRTVRQLVALDLGRQNNYRSVAVLKELLGDEELYVRMAACLSLYRIFDDASIDLLADILLNGKDNLCVFIAELLAFKPGQGHAILKELLETGNIVSKKAAISGLRLINEAWADELLQKASTSDEQWFVRDAAAHALESKWNVKHYVPSKRMDPSETSWLIKFASQEGYSVPAGIYPYALLYRLIDSGTLEERLLSLAYLADKPDEHTLPKMKELISTENPLREEAAFLLSLLHQQK